ncbi:hypothetical protein HAX54_023643 [Datura stramonium]|uniref:Uncharacterized protein n=1 Tax=Datura stramonium TaxID=4076 RepID=A0ABS8UZI5_DATST|nr:hypothetical protein [Datura stramonium]
MDAVDDANQLRETSKNEVMSFFESSPLLKDAAEIEKVLFEGRLFCSLSLQKGTCQPFVVLCPDDPLLECFSVADDSSIEGMALPGQGAEIECPLVELVDDGAFSIYQKFDA